MNTRHSSSLTSLPPAYGTGRFSRLTYGTGNPKTTNVIGASLQSIEWNSVPPSREKALPQSSHSHRCSSSISTSTDDKPPLREGDVITRGGWKATIYWGRMSHKLRVHVEHPQLGDFDPVYVDKWLSIDRHYHIPRHVHTWIEGICRRLEREYVEEEDL